jgi:hypothetical protein
MGGAYSTHGIDEKIGKPEGKKPHGRSRSRWEDNTGMVLR